MIDVSHRVLSNVKEYIKDICNNVVGNNSNTPVKFPSVSVVQYDSTDIGTDLENNETSVKSLIEIQSFSNKSVNESKEIINKVCDAMRVMGYKRTYGPSNIPNENKNIYRMVARFERIVSSVNEIKKM